MCAMTDRVVLITGAVGNLGQAVARAFQRVEARTVLLDRSSERLRKTYAETAGASACMLAGEVDLADAESVGAAVKATLDRYGRIDALVNTVGGFRGGYPVVEQGSDDWDFLLGVNLKTTLNTSRAVIPTMVAQRAGRIINVASRAALTGDAGLAAYSASKAAVLRLTESLAAELKDAGVNANCVLPGTIDTPQNRAAMPAADFARWVAPQDVAGVIVFLASDAARAITGAAIPVYGRG